MNHKLSAMLLLIFLWGAACDRSTPLNNTTSSHIIGGQTQSSILTEPSKSEAQFTALLEDKSLDYKVSYNPNWERIDSEFGNGVTFNLGPKQPVFSISVNGQTGGVPTLAYYSILKGQPLRPLDMTNLPTQVCALRDDTNVYIQRENVIYTISASTSDNSPLSPELIGTFNAFVLTFAFVEPWSNSGAPRVTPPTPTPCWL